MPDTPLTTGKYLLASASQGEAASPMQSRPSRHPLRYPPGRGGVGLTTLRIGMAAAFDLVLLPSIHFLDNLVEDRLSTGAARPRAIRARRWSMPAAVKPGSG